MIVIISDGNLLKVVDEATWEKEKSLFEEKTTFRRCKIFKVEINKNKKIELYYHRIRDEWIER